MHLIHETWLLRPPSIQKLHFEIFYHEECMRKKCTMFFLKISDNSEGLIFFF